MKRYSTLPLTLYRFQTTMRPKLRQHSAQLSKGQSSFDFKLGPNNLYHPMEGDTFIIPNGLSMRPIGMHLAQFMSQFQGKYIFQLPKDLVLPENLILIHEHSDHYSLQTRVPIEPQKFCIQVQKILRQQKQLSKMEMLEMIRNMINAATK